MMPEHKEVPKIGDKTELKDKFVSGLFWRFAERIGLQLVTVVVNVVLARVLLPEEYGVQAILMVFISFATVLTISGFSASLIQKLDVDEVDYSSVFYFNLVYSLVVYFILFALAPVVADFYGNSMLKPLLRVISLSIPVGSLNSVQYVYVSRNMMFKKFFFSTLGGTLASAVVGLLMAFAGYGVWALVGQYLTNVVIDSVVLWFTVRWRPGRRFSFTRIKQLFGFGWRVLLMSLMDTGYSELYNMLVGKVYKMEQLAYYSKGQEYPKMGTTVIVDTLGTVLFPALAIAQQDKGEAKAIVQRTLRTISYVLCPVLIGFACVAKPFVQVVLTDKWLLSVPYVQLFCITYLFYPIQQIGRQLLTALGQVKLRLRIEVVLKVVGLAVLVAAMFHSVMAVAVAALVSSILSAILIMAPCSGLIGYSVWQQIGDFVPAVLLSLGMGAVVMLVGLLPLGPLAMLAVQVLAGAASYLLFSLVFKVDSFQYLWKMLKGYLSASKKSGG